MSEMNFRLRAIAAMAALSAAHMPGGIGGGGQFPFPPGLDLSGLIRRPRGKSGKHPNGGKTRNWFKRTTFWHNLPAHQNGARQQAWYERQIATGIIAADQIAASPEALRAEVMAQRTRSVVHS